MRMMRLPVVAGVAGAMMLLLGALWLTTARGQQGATGAPRDAQREAGGGGGGGGGGAGGGGVVVFMPVEVYVDTGKTPLGAYQVELTARGATIVGLEGGGEKAFREAYYDPAALRGNRIIVASFSTEEQLPAGKTRVARLHLMITGADALGDDGLPAITRKLVVATDGQGKSVDATVTVEKMQGDKP